MLVDHQSPLDLNVTITILNEHRNQVKKVQFKNTATRRMTTGIALFLAGDEATYENRTRLDAPASGLGRWRPNFISFATTGIDLQPTEPGGLATVNDIAAFENKNPEPGERTRPWYLSEYLGEHSDGFWNPAYGWGTAEHPDTACFQGELATAVDNSITRHPLLRAEVTTDNSWERTVGQEGYSTDCILYGYTSVLWGNQLFNPENGPTVPRIAISELGLYEMDSTTEVGRRSLMAGFRVPTVEDIIYVEPGYVMLVEWRITVRSLMPYEGVAAVGEPVPTGISIESELIDEYHAQLTAQVRGGSLVPQGVTWSLSGQTSPQTTISDTGYLTIGAGESSTTFTVRAQSTRYPEIFTTASVISTSSASFTVDYAALLSSEQSVSYTTGETMPLAAQCGLTAIYGGAPSRGVCNGYRVLFNVPYADITQEDVSSYLELNTPWANYEWQQLEKVDWKYVYQCRLTSQTVSSFTITVYTSVYDKNGDIVSSESASRSFSYSYSGAISSLVFGIVADFARIVEASSSWQAVGVHGRYQNIGHGKSGQSIIVPKVWLNGTAVDWSSSDGSVSTGTFATIKSLTEWHFDTALNKRYEPSEGD